MPLPQVAAVTAPVRRRTLPEGSRLASREPSGR
jgi:hypothetical protein